jgi:phage gp46-like protein
MNTVRLESWCDIRELVLMSVGTDKGSWWADADFGSELFLLRASGRVDGNTAGDLKRMIGDCLDWLVKDGLVKKITVSASRSGKNSIDYEVGVFKPDGDNILIKDVWNV